MELGGKPLVAVNLLVAMLISYGTLDDERHALEAVLVATTSFLDEERQVYCDELIQEFHTALQRKNHMFQQPSPDAPLILSKALQKRIEDFLCALPDIHDTRSLRALIYHAGLDHQLQDQISFGFSPAQFVKVLISTLIQYNRLHDGRNALEAVLDAAKSFVDEEHQAYCEQLIQEVKTASFKYETSQAPSSSIQQKTRVRVCENCGVPLSFFERLLRQTTCKRCRERRSGQ